MMGAIARGAVVQGENIRIPFLAFFIILIIFFPEVVDEKKMIYFFKQFLLIILWLNISPIKQKRTYAVFS